jgi:hypothetical protein
MFYELIMWLGSWQEIAKNVEQAKRWCQNNISVYDTAVYSFNIDNYSNNPETLVISFWEKDAAWAGANRYYNTNWGTGYAPDYLELDGVNVILDSQHGEIYLFKHPLQHTGQDRLSLVDEDGKYVYSGYTPKETREKFLRWVSRKR